MGKVEALELQVIGKNVNVLGGGEGGGVLASQLACTSS